MADRPRPACRSLHRRRRPPATAAPGRGTGAAASPRPARSPVWPGSAGGPGARRRPRGRPRGSRSSPRGAPAGSFRRPRWLRPMPRRPRTRLARSGVRPAARRRIRRRSRSRLASRPGHARPRGTGPGPAPHPRSRVGRGRRPRRSRRRAPAPRHRAAGPAPERRRAGRARRGRRGRRPPARRGARGGAWPHRATRASRGVWMCHDRHMELTFLGGARTVTGSRHLVDTGRAKVLIDCGMFQGGPDETIRNHVPLGFDPATLDAVVLTHAHLDHCGLLPLLVHEGFRGAIVCTAATAELARLVLLDSAKLQEEFAKRAARHAKRDPGRAAHDAARNATEYERAAPASPPRAPRARAGRIPRSSCARPGPEVMLHLGDPLYTEDDVDLTLSMFQTDPVRHGARGGPGRPRHARRRRPHPGLGDRAHAARAPGRRARHDRRLLGRPRPARHADHPRPDARSPRATSSCASPPTAAASTSRRTRRSTRSPTSSTTRCGGRASCSSPRSRSGAPRRSCGS